MKLSSLFLLISLTASAVFAGGPEGTAMSADFGSDAIKARLLGRHKLTLQWIDGSAGAVDFKDEHGAITVMGNQTAPNGDYVSLNGAITHAYGDVLIFSGKIETKVSYINGGKVCTRESDRIVFAVTQGRSYYRMRFPDMYNPCEGGQLVDYIDIQVQK